MPAMAYVRAGVTSLHSILGDGLVYRNLRPIDARLPDVAALRQFLGLDDAPVVPRKAAPAFGKVVAEMLRQARGLELPGVGLRRVIYVGDNEASDGAAFANLCSAGGWSGRAFIGQDDLRRQRSDHVEGNLYLSNRWSGLYDFVAGLERSGFGLDEQTVVVADVDKTLIGARGRNDAVIVQARLEALQCTVGGLLGPRFDALAFRAAYDELNQATYFGLTEDNQDYLAYICLVLGSGLFRLDDLAQQARSGSLRFAEWIQRVDERRAELALAGLGAVHDGIWGRVRAGDPTPFKAFRHNEYLSTLARFGDEPERSPEQVLARRVAITHEVRDIVGMLRRRGALAFGLSDKPDEAALPSEDQARRGLPPLHRAETIAVGEALNTDGRERQ